jgi:hypothetical protein
MSRNAYSYEEFNLDAALNLSSHTERKSIKLAGVENIRSIYNNPSTSTEEFIIGAVEALGNANRNLMYANMSIEGFAQRFQVAVRVAKNVNLAHNRGLEGFENVHSMNPLAYSIEDGEKKGKFKAFVGRIWEALKTAARHIMTSIANFIKYIINKIREFGLKKAIKDKKDFDEAWKKASSDKQKEIGDKKIMSMKWHKDVSTKFQSVITSVSKKYNETFDFSSNDDYKALLKATKLELKDINSADKLNGLQKGFGTGLSPKHIQEVAEKIEKFQKEGTLLDGITGATAKNDKGKANGASKALAGVFFEGDKPAETTIKDLKEKTKNFECLNEGWFKKEITDTIASANKAQKGMTAYTKAIDMFVAKYNKLTKDVDAEKDEFKKFAMSIGRLSLKRMALNSYMQSILMEVEINAFRLTSTCHKAVRVGLKTLKGNKKDEKKSGESLYQPSVDELFSDL